MTGRSPENIVVAGERGQRTAVDMRHVVAIAEGERVQHVFLVNGPEPMPVELDFHDLVQMWQDAQCSVR